MASERKIIKENVRRVLLTEYILKETQRAGFGGLDIQRTPMGTRVTLIAERPGLVIGRQGATVKALTEAVGSKFNFDNPQIEVQEVNRPELNAQIMAEKLSNALERGWHFRRAGHSTVRRIMEAGAKGCIITVAGKLTGRRHRTQKFKAGHIKYCGEPSYTFMDKGFAVAKMKPGVIGVTVWIMDPDAKLPDDITVAPPGEGSALPEPPPAEAEEPAADTETAEVTPEDVAQAVVADTLPDSDATPEPAGKGKFVEKKIKQATKELGRKVDAEGGD